MARRALIVCVGNICRSPMAEALLRHRLPTGGCIVESAGLAAVEGAPIDPLAEAMLATSGLSAGSHAARQVDPALIENADIVLAMEKRHLAALHALAPGSRSRTFLLGKWQGNIDIPDPYGRRQAVFAQVYGMIDAAIDEWRSRIGT